MRSPRLLTAGLLLTAALTGCSDDEPQAAGSTARPSPTATATATATSSSSAQPSPSAAPTTTTSGASSSGASSPTPSRTTGGAAPTTAAPAPSGSPRLTGEGVALGGQVVTFGTPYEQARPVLDAALGEPSTDTGVTDSFGPYGTCPGTQLRALEYGGGALQLLFGDVAGSGLTLYHWGLTTEGSPSQVPRASALVGDAATFEFGVGTTVAQLQEGAPPAPLEVSAGDEVFPASFRLQDQSSGFFGYLTGTGAQDTATYVQGGQGCGE